MTNMFRTIEEFEAMHQSLAEELFGKPKNVEEDKS